MPDTPMLMMNDGRAIPAIGAGTYQIADAAASGVADMAARMGYALVDTAAIYANEAGVGRGLADHREVFVTTKMWNDRHGYDSAIAAFEQSLALLGRDSVDLYLIHWPVPRRGGFIDSWRALVRLREEGRAKSIGVSNFLPDHIDAIADVTGVLPALNQIELHPRFQQAALRDYHKKHNIVTQCWSPLGQGELLNHPLIRRISDKQHCTTSQVILAWELALGLATIPKASSEKHLAANLGATGVTLDAEDMHAIAQLDDPGGRMGPDPLTFE